ncbi:MAG: tRNA glutamyl-Q(34) synthetase GluQRS [Gammaproteobacteria bacterium]|nr:tRNA glutamyl-Q(34) synthetase GluQRS [Gammaproteobacteria bacterium]
MPEAKTSSYRGRFAPSPSGPLHFGSLVAAIGSYLDARSCNGEWLIRIEDLDPPREKPGAASAILRTLEAFGFEWDEEPLYQSNRIEAYHAALDKLLNDGLAYPCGCTRREVAAAGLSGQEGPRYPGTCRTTPPTRPSPHSMRLWTTHTGESFTDRICGQLHQNIGLEVGDFVLRRADGHYAYQLAVAVDDGAQQITRVVRGADLLTSTPRQIYLQRLLNLPTPEYAHLPLVLDDEGRKLSKHSSARALDISNPLPSLLSACRFLAQPAPPHHPANLSEFWEWAIARWQLEQIPVHQQNNK